MSHRILLCWELGGGWGHLFRLSALAGQLRRAGHDVSLAVPDPACARRVVSDSCIRFFQAPAWSPPGADLPLSLNYAQNLWRNGFRNLAALRANLRAWIQLVETLQPDALVAEHAPTALLALRGTGVKRLAVGTGFTLPPLQEPMPTMQPWFQPSERLLREAERQWLQNTNQVMKEFGKRPLESVAAVFEDADRMLCTFPELDHYGRRTGETYWGPVLTSDSSQKPVWPRETEPGSNSVFVYLAPEYPFLGDVLSVLKATEWPILAVIPGLPPEVEVTLKSDRLSIMTSPVDLREVVRRSTFAVTHGGTNTGTHFFLSGKPLMFCPRQLEQCLWSYNLSKQGYGVMLNFFSPRPGFSRALAAMLQPQNGFPKLSAFRERYADFDSRSSLWSMTRRLAGDNNFQPCNPSGLDSGARVR